MWAYWGIGLLCLRQGDLPRALPQLERAVGLCHEVDLPVYFPMLAAALGVAYTLAGRSTDAVPLLTQAAAVMEREDFSLKAFHSLPLGQAYLLGGRLEEDNTLAERTLALTRAHRERGYEAYALRLLSDIAARREPPGRALAEAHYREALALAEALGMRPLQAHCYRDLGTLYTATGQREQAHTALTTAIDMYRAMEMTFWLPETEAALAQVEREN